MKSNYVQQLAWFAQAIKPQLLAQHSSTPWLRQVNTDKDDIVVSPCTADQEDVTPNTPIPKKRPREEELDVNERSPFIRTMQDDFEYDYLLSKRAQTSSPMADIEHFMFDDFSDIDFTYVDENEIGINQENSSNYTPIRSASEVSLYYDAHEDWSHNVETPTSTEEHLPLPALRERIESILQDKFKTKGFIPNQYEAITAAIDGGDIFILLPAGPSRNLCFQLPVFFQNQPSPVTIVITPSLIHLLEKDDHTMELHNIPTLFVSNSKKTHKKNWISRAKLSLEAIYSTQLLYMTFSDFSKCENLIKTMHEKGLLARFIIDEAHCVSQWLGSEDFIFGYSKTTQNLRKRYPSIPITALTAISNDRTHLDIIHHLGLQIKNCKIYKKSILL